jgi:hypothetical protein
MDTSEIIPRLEALTRAMSDKGLVCPDAHLSAYSHNSIQIFVCDDQDRSNRHCDGATVEAAFDKAEAYIAGLPSLEELARQRFLQLAGAAADYAAEHLPGDEIASAVRASIVAGMQRLSENMLTDQSGAA